MSNRDLPDFQRRTYSLDQVEVRDAPEPGAPFPFFGHAALFNRATWIGPKKWGFREQVAPGAFARTINDHDVRFLYNHEPDSVMARSSAGDLRLSEDEVGLRTEADLAPDDLDVQRIVPKLRNKHVTQMSFGMEVIRDEWETDPDTGDETRTILEVKLWDVSPVTFPAYEDTDAALRSVAFDVLATRLGLSTKKRARLIAGMTDDDLDDETRSILRSASDNIASILGTPGPAETTQDPEQDHGPAETTRGVPLSVRRLRHDHKAKGLALT